MLLHNAAATPVVTTATSPHPGIHGHSTVGDESRPRFLFLGVHSSLLDDLVANTFGSWAGGTSYGTSLSLLRIRSMITA